MKKSILSVKILMMMALSISVFSCSDIEDPEGTQRYKEAPILLSSTPATGSSVSFLANTVDLIFDREVTVIDLADIVISNNATVESSTIVGDTLRLIISGTDEKTDYTISIPAGTIKGVPGTMNKEEISLSFKTNEAPAIQSALANANATTQAKNVYKYLLENYRSKMLSGAMAKVNWNTEEADRVYRWTGKYPAMNTFDFVHHYASPASWIDYTNTSVVENWWNSKGLVSIMWHWNVPAETASSEYGFYYTAKNKGEGETNFDITQAVKAGTTENTIIKADLDKIASYLLALQQKGIPVIWRPLHEAAGGWFWWGAKDSESYKTLWKLMFDTFKQKGVNNLIWVWTTETNDASWYPGDEYVDVIGRDIYNKTDAKDIYKEYLSIRKAYPTKLISLSECGNVADIVDQWNSQAKWSWFMPWYDNNATDTSVHGHATKEFWIKAFASGQVITRDQVPSLK